MLRDANTVTETLPGGRGEGASLPVEINRLPKMEAQEGADVHSAAIEGLEWN
jgi:hypothetical protein